MEIQHQQNIGYLIWYASHFKFVKEKRNLIPTNLWSGTDLLKAITDERTSTTYFACTKGLTSLSSITEWCSNGERSIQQDFSQRLDYCECHISDIDITKNYTAKVDIFSESTPVILQFLAMTESQQVLVKTAEASLGQKCTLSATINSNELTENITELKVRIITTDETPDIFYTDNWCLIED